VGPKTELVKDLHFGYARYQFQESTYDSQINDYLALFVKGSKDGADRDERPLNSLICLDISGSMGGGLGAYNYANFKSRLWLSVEAIKMFISKLRPTDSVGVITFNSHAQIILEPTYKSNLPADFFDQLDKIKANGGTTIRSGFEMAVNLLRGFISDNKLKDSENRIIMLTDVCDNSIQN
jgi:Ca-activated chloride channel homolog